MFKKGLPIFMYNADEGGLGSGNGESKVEDNGTEIKDTETKNEPLTLEQVQKMIQSENDKIRGEYSKKLKDKEKELEDLRLASMTEDERKVEELKKREEAIQKQQTELTLAKLTIETVDLLKENNLPLEAKDFLIGKDSDSTKANIQVFKTMFESALETEVHKRFQSTGKEFVDATKSVKGLTREDIKTMSASEINANWDAVQRVLNGK